MSKSSAVSRRAFGAPHFGDLPQASTKPCPRPWALGVTLLLWNLGAQSCVFFPPPPLPEEIAAELAAKAQDDAVQGGSVEAAPQSFQKGEEAPPGLRREDRIAYNRAQGDPHAQGFALASALEGLEGQGKLWAQLTTSKGVMQCELFEGSTPKTVANFVGLARGKRPYRDPDQQDLDSWVTGRYYDNTQFHRVIPDFMIQGGDPTASGRGGPGYVIADELVPGSRFDRAGLLAMANRGPGTGGAQFFITLGPTSHLNGLHTIFGQCTPASAVVAAEIAQTQRDSNDRPATPMKLESVQVYRADQPRAGERVGGSGASVGSGASQSSGETSTQEP